MPAFDNKADASFRTEVRDFLKANLPARLSDKVRRHMRLSKQDMEDWHAILHARGWLGASWPVEHGGTGWNATHKFIFEEECCLAHAPRIVPFGITMLAPVLMKFGSREQQVYYLPRILNGDDWWCQGYSEPNAGSDLASLKCRAVRDGDTYVVNGQKTWTTLGQHATHIFCLVRTSTEGKPQQGISFLLIDMATPGIEVRPIRLLEGTHEVNEVFFTDVKVPVENLVGEENQGWTYAKYLLIHERTNIAGVGFAEAALEHVKMLASEVQQAGKPMIDDALFAARMARAEIALRSLRTTTLRVIASVEAGGAPGVESSMLKVLGTQIRQEITDLTRRVLGPQALPFASEALDEGYNETFPGHDSARWAAQTYFNNRKLSIYGGSNEVQRTLIARQLLAD
jgi:alkylation response protein AidB-like acyl-CoA dehydrogenase